MENKRFSVCLIWERSEGNNLKRSSKLVANIDANGYEEAVGKILHQQQNMFENWRLAAALSQEQLVAEPEEGKPIITKH